MSKILNTILINNLDLRLLDLRDRLVLLIKKIGLVAKTQKKVDL